MMKKMMTIGTTCLLATFLAACGSQDSPSTEPADDQTAEDVAERISEEQQDETNTEDSIDEESTTDDSNTNETITEATNQEDMQEMMAALNFSEIEIEVSYGPDQEYEAEIDHRDNGDLEADLEDDLNGIEIENDLEAFNELYPKVKQLDVTQETAKEDVIQQVLQAFDLKEDYTKFDVEIKFNDGTKVSYEDK